ncbi:uncharacterized protein TNCT_230981 [Trichonephila clavata]|uniref:Uncharacterized protein n=1 Tax=Trichonephila clavata TaxID=2740835 RepID=A0A8X6I069_TRICU|nr:uncharacterized protein TNCT_230981 [Trichonephila clavata]
MRLPRTFLSLQQMCLSKIALVAYNDPDIKHFTNTYDIHSCIWAMETLVGQKISTLPLPNIIRKEVLALVRLTFIESDKWLEDHAQIMMYTTNLQNSFHWTQDNKIDRQKTARAIVAKNNIDISDRFLLACHYCFEDDVFSLWGKLNSQQQKFFQKSKFEIVRIWADWIRDGEELDWEEIVRSSRNNPLGLRTYISKLKKVERLHPLLLAVRRGCFDHHELQFCLSKLDQDQENKIFKECPLQILEVFLHWPVQGELLEVVELLRPYLSAEDFRDFFYLIISQKFMFDSVDFYYVSVIKKLWRKIPSLYREFIENDSLYNTLKLVLEYNGFHPFPHTLRVYSNEDSFIAFHLAGTMFVIFKDKIPLLNFIFPFFHFPNICRRVSVICFS